MAQFVVNAFRINREERTSQRCAHGDNHNLVPSDLLRQTDITSRVQASQSGFVAALVDDGALAEVDDPTVRADSLL